MAHPVPPESVLAFQLPQRLWWASLAYTMTGSEVAGPHLRMQSEALCPAAPAVRSVGSGEDKRISSSRPVSAAETPPLILMNGDCDHQHQPISTLIGWHRHPGV